MRPIDGDALLAEIARLKTLNLVISVRNIETLIKQGKFDLLTEHDGLKDENVTRYLPRVHMLVAKDNGAEFAEKIANELIEGAVEVVSIVSQKESFYAAKRTLENLGYTYKGGKVWKPPLGKAPDFDLLNEQRERADRYREKALNFCCRVHRERTHCLGKTDDCPKDDDEFCAAVIQEVDVMSDTVSRPSMYRYDLEEEGSSIKYYIVQPVGAIEAIGDEEVSDLLIKQFIADEFNTDIDRLEIVGRTRFDPVCPDFFEKGNKVDR